MTSPEQISAAPARPRTDAAPLLDVRGLGISFAGPDKRISVVRDVTFSVAPGECVGLVGESGCGKTVTGLALMGLLPVHGSRFEGQLLLDGEDLLMLSETQWRKRRGRRLGMIFQEPMSALDPVFTIGEQIGETLRTHFRISRREARDRAIEALEAVGISEPVRRHDAYPHELSGGMRQRAMIAMAISCEPALLIADEPTTALDVTVQAQIMDVLGELSARSGMAMLFISHDLGLVSQTCSRIVTMYAGEVVEIGETDDVLLKPLHPYTSGLLRSLPSFTERKGRLPSIPGRVPRPGDFPETCRFQDRCAHFREGCLTRQHLLRIGEQRFARCHCSEKLDLPGVLS
ncbi:ATP-binding cassette domain-containing protein (plasmid) [Ponticoccus alexandrii]|uniref:ATP-binding cassette domain-containing protein n=1 Tax=Ponticoccus alexandrii TaxID=1943633 RepID=A0ABX7FDY7_9RHOB|nr:ABC transporter ATP-binding protein [Ponticoccus alexandrii]QRF68781.1 ATP-binding cassette domain-containing protein [Ponticoccus alexandrii]